MFASSLVLPLHKYHCSYSSMIRFVWGCTWCKSLGAGARAEADRLFPGIMMVRTVFFGFVLKVFKRTTENRGRINLVRQWKKICQLLFYFKLLCKNVLSLDFNSNLWNRSAFSPSKKCRYTPSACGPDCGRTRQPEWKVLWLLFLQGAHF